ncbi:MAG: penicillin-binding protein 2 [Deltaproteobacteria bacterium RIFCSPLOWO2_12_FULL_40_28]|nr:MAG: penicillin-binding protein 2 [Deltaproteobacteria bacterium RIFCSPHIGHO2_02_FULL_40_28]OGQ19748.1 MAG: penicillin-binding protein 2 [Deltaproteobacteria bacterium RIFCSPHIGHO2_12_FULL_40_32]OGQ41025.1 MAG: penicillin-binding protein 2 [Deltaproteobacteria bacterium RIFCSPLOWO2_02_FULL_40_36]OGQ54141.1 MAG: penicillin-binding protein 2 [Deltaproteobacteria bacterium RIFCSPLOWO2_12_FULL_40_28]
MVNIGRDEDIQILQKRASIFLVIILLFIATALIRLFYLQILKGDTYRLISDQISVREEELRAPRGLILDRNGKILADNRPYYEITVIPQDMGLADQTLNSLGQLLSIQAQTFKSQLNALKYQPHFMPVVLIEDADFESISKIKQYQQPEYDESHNGIYLAGVDVSLYPLRTYLYPELFSHVLGYLKEPNPKNLEDLEKKFPNRYSLGDLMGASGVEFSYDLDLKGIDGVKARVVDAKGKEIRGDPDLDILQERASSEPVPGYNLVTGLDYEAQSKAAELIAGRRGSVVAIDPNTGEVLVLYSSPGFDGNRITKKIDKSYWQKINLHEDHILYNRAIQAAYPPGSIYKVVGVFAGLADKKITPETTFHCGGGIQFGNRFFKCWNKGGHGSVALLRGIGQSCDSYFYQVGLRVGVDGLKKYATLFNLGQKTGIDLPFEQAGLIPSEEWKMQRYKQPWVASETLSIAIGQGYDLVTPLQAATMVSMIANGGYSLVPHVGVAIRDVYGSVIKDIPSTKGARIVPENIVQWIQKGMIEVIHGEGTAKKLKASPYKIAGKTGTAQVVGHDSGISQSGRHIAHGWFMAYAPYDDPKIAIAVIVENGGSGSGAAAPVAMAVIDEYLKKLLPKERVARGTPDEAQLSRGRASAGVPQRQDPL